MRWNRLWFRPGEGTQHSRSAGKLHSAQAGRSASNGISQALATALGKEDVRQISRGTTYGASRNGSRGCSRWFPPARVGGWPAENKAATSGRSSDRSDLQPVGSKAWRVRRFKDGVKPRDPMETQRRKPRWGHEAKPGSQNRRREAHVSRQKTNCDVWLRSCSPDWPTRLAAPDGESCSTAVSRETA